MARTYSQSDSSAASYVRVVVACDPRVNFALQQNSVPFVKRIVIDNRSGADLTDVVVEVSTVPEVAERAEFRIDRVSSATTHEMVPVAVRLRPEFLVAQQERESGTLRVRMTARGELVAETTAPFEILAYDEWNGTASLPEILAAFVLPNHPAVEQILQTARDLLGDRTKNPALEGYQGRDPKRVLQIVEAVYDAVRRLELTYASPPASFESNGQKVRTPDRVAGSRMATCLDLALLFAACLEQAGLHALVILVQGHAFAGAWLVEESFPEAATTEPYRLLKRVELDAIRVVETTGVASRPQISFADAVREGRRRLEVVDQFLFSVDVRSARRARIRPIPMRVAPGTVAVVAEIRPVAEESEVELHPTRPATPSSSVDAPETPRSRLDRWKRKLLDLTLRNRLLNHRDTRQTIPLLFPDVARVEDALADGHALEILPKPAMLRGDDPRDPVLHRGQTGEDGVRVFVAEELKARRVHTGLEEDDLEGRLLEISRTARLSLEEGGANTLYLALGFLTWYETPSSEEPRLAPLLLIPVALDRRTALDRFHLRLLDDDVRPNVTLLQKLKSEYGVEIPGLDPLPEDDVGIDVPAVLRAVREAVLQLPRWHVREDAVVGIFSFSKYLMWLDLEARHEVLARNEVVRHLIEGAGGAFRSDGPFPEERKLDEERDPASTFCPLDADSSQLAAVHAASDGRTFVLQGPPGTGKSQTITNLIVQCLALGRRVLFVSEKMAALDVVHRRLERVGVGHFCLPLHSNKAQKKEVLERIGEARDLAAQASPSDWETRAAELQEVRAGLNRYCRALHQPRHFGITAFQAIAERIGLRDEHEVVLDLGDPSAAPSDLPAKLRAAAAILDAEVREVGGVRGHPLAAVRLNRWRPETEDDARRLAIALSEGASALEQAVLPVARSMGLPERPWLEVDLDRLAEWCGLLADAPTTDVSALVAAPDWDAVRAEAAKAIEVGRDRDLRRKRLLARYRPGLLDAPLDAWIATLRRIQASWAPIRWWNGRGVRRALTEQRVDAASATDEARLVDLDEALAVRTLTRELEATASAGSRLFGAAWKAGEADWAALESATTWAGRFRNVLARSAGSVDERVRLRDLWLRMVRDGRDLFLEHGKLRGEYAAFLPALTRYRTARVHFVQRLQVDESIAFATATSQGTLKSARDTAAVVQDNVARLRAWCGYQRARSEAAALGLSPLVEDLESGALPAERLLACLDRSFYAWWLHRVFAEDPALAEFSSTRHALTIERFRKLDREILGATSGVVQARLAASLPRSDPNLSGKSEMGILQRQLQKKSRHMPLRKLFQQIPNALSRLKPCMLMSPLSVAQYLSPEFPPFDVVVFDEASQIPVWDAIGAIARGAKLVVVGDSKQLPPTSFFEKEDAEEELDEDDVEDLESILDECVAAGLPERTLDWHYRSKHESLIAFSNRHYYRGRLLTFPSAEATVERMGVSLRPVPGGVYDKGHSRTNRGEAEELVNELVRRLRDPKEATRSVGVVTFSMPQQRLVEDLLESARRKYPEIEPYFDLEREEPVFVKNLENVQGDERDVILFSVCYGPDAQRRVYMNFGPLNRDGGERRLNVAITRAKQQVVVFSTLRAEQIDLARTRAVGVQHLKAFLEYAERGASALSDAGVGPTGADWDSPFEEAVERTLVDRGWSVHRQVGCSGYRIDLAVVDAERPGRYLLGIECDGASYHSARTARDRDRLRESVLRSLGWRLHRVWSTDWWYDPAREAARIEEAIARARSLAGEPPAADVVATPVQSPAAEPLRFASMVADAAAAAPVRTPPSGPTYPAPLSGPSRGTPQTFVLAWSDEEIARTLRDVVDVESPVLLDLAARRVGTLWGLRRVSGRTVERIGGLAMRAGVRVVRDDAEIVLWRPDHDPSAFADFRRPADAASPERTADQVPLIELAHAVAYVLEAHLSAPVDEVARETARLFGITRLGSGVRARMEQAIHVAARDGRCRVDGGMVTIVQAS